MNWRANILKLAAFGFPIFTCGATEAVVMYDEAVSGDLSGDRLNPNHFTVSAGVNSLLATTGWETNPQDIEYVRLDLPAGHQLSNINLESYSEEFGISFIGVQAGPIFTFDSGDAIDHIGDMLGWAHFGPGVGHVIGQDILPDIAEGSMAIGFTPPLTGATYTFWIQQTENNVNYQFDFIVSGPTQNELPGDYNGNQTVDAADYVVWRNGGPLQNEIETIDSVTSHDYTAWRARFGTTLGIGTTTSVPEPATAVFALLGIAARVALGRRSRARRTP